MQENAQTILPVPRVAALHDLSCLGRCALTVIMPTLSVMGYQVIPVPTALLSTHTGGYDHLHFRDLTSDMEQIGNHFTRLGTSFRAIYTGFLGSAEQIRTVETFLDRFSGVPDETGELPLILIDPVMGDDGSLYSTYTKELADGIRHLSRRAQILTPNLTEACFLTDTPYRDPARMSEAEAFSFADALLDRLARQTSGRIVITGIRLAGGDVANAGLDLDGSRFRIRKHDAGRSYPGTGDLFACVLLGELLRGKNFREACRRAAGFVADLIARSCSVDAPVRAGVSLEPELWRLTPKH